MRMIKRLHLVGCLLIGFLHVSCTQELSEPAGKEDNGTVDFGIDTRANDVAVGTTFRIMVYSANLDEDPYRFKQTGTYYLKNKTDDALTACTVDADGTNPRDNENAGVNGANGSSFVVFVSPGVKSEEDGSFSFNPATQELHASSAEQKALGIYGLHKMNSKIRDRRAKIRFNFYKNEASTEDFTIKNLKLIGNGDGSENVNLFPASRQVVASEDGRKIRIEDKKSEDTTNKEGNQLYYSSEEVYVASAIYAPLDEVAKRLDLSMNKQHLQESSYLRMVCDLSQGERKEMPVRMALTAGEISELEPQSTYVFNITISSTYITATLDVYNESNNWEDGGNEGGTISKPDYTVTLGTWKVVGNGNDWELVEIDNPNIGGNK